MKLKILDKQPLFEWVRHKQFVLRCDLRFECKERPSKYGVGRKFVPYGFVTDGATIMFRLLSLILERTEAMRATTIHDYCVRMYVFSPYAKKNWHISNRVFCLALKLDGVSPWRIFVIRHFLHLIGIFVHYGH